MTDLILCKPAEVGQECADCKRWSENPNLVLTRPTPIETITRPGCRKCDYVSTDSVELAEDKIKQLILQRKLRLVLKPDYVRSSSDTDLHFISASSLLQLYGVAGFPFITYPTDFFSRRRWVRQERDVELYPRDRGDYSLVAAVKRSIKKEELKELGIYEIIYS